MWSQEYFKAARDTEGHIRLLSGRGLMVAHKDHTRDDVQRWFDMAVNGYYREQYRAALDLIDAEAGQS